MDVTADTLLNQVSTLILDKVDKQNLDPNFLKGFMNTLLNKFTYKDTNPIKQQSKASTQTSSSPGGIVNDIKKAYKELLKDASYISDYKQFLKKVFPTISLQEQKILTPITPTPSANITNVTNNSYNEENYAEGRPDLIKQEVKPQVVLLGGITEQGYRSLQEKLPNILKGLFTKEKVQEKPASGGLGLLGGGIALLLGGLAALVTGLMTDGPFKGLLKILSKAGLSGGIKLLETAAKLFIGGLKELLMAPINLLDDAAKLIGKIFGKETYKAVLKPLRGMTGLFTKMLSGLAKTLTPLLKKLPLIGTIISWGFAYSRFKSGDVVGGVIDILSGIATIFPGVGTAIAIGLDVLNAFLDFKGGGATAEASDKKGNIAKGWLENAWNYWKEQILNVPLIKNITDLGNAFSQGDWSLALTKLVRLIPGASWLLDWMGMTEEKSVEVIDTQFNMISDFFTWIKESVIDKITNTVSKVIDWSKEKITSIISSIPGYNLLFGDDTSEQNSTPTDNKPTRSARGSKANTAHTTATTQPEVKLAEGGIVTKPTTALVGEAGPEAVLPLDKMFDSTGISLNNTALDQIADNTKNTNQSLNALADAIIKMVGVFNQKLSTQGSTTVINAGGGSKDYTSASMAANLNSDPIRRVRAQFAV